MVRNSWTLRLIWFCIDMEVRENFGHRTGEISWGSSRKMRERFGELVSNAPGKGARENRQQKCICTEHEPFRLKAPPFQFLNLPLSLSPATPSKSRKSCRYFVFCTRGVRRFFSFFFNNWVKEGYSKRGHWGYYVGFQFKFLNLYFLQHSTCFGPQQKWKIKVWRTY